MRGSAHAHFLIWVAHAPSFNAPNEEKTNFVNNFISAKLPSVDEDPELRELVLKHQVHKHYEHCLDHKTGTCIYNFRRSLSNKIIIPTPLTIGTNNIQTEIELKNEITRLRKIWSKVHNA